MMKWMQWAAPAAMAAVTCGVLLAHPEGFPFSKGNKPPAGYPVVERPADPPISPELELVAHLALPGPIGDLWAHKNTVYLGNWGGPTGVRIVDISNPAQPALIGTLPVRPGTSYEDLMAISVDTPHFQGDLLAVGLQRQSNGAQFWDVTDPRQPRLLGAYRVGQVHELFLLQRDDRVLALLACLDEGLRIVDVTNPAQPRQLSVWRLQRQLGINPGLGIWPFSFCHSVSASADGSLAYLSYWDAGAVILDIADPAQPRFLGRTLYPPTEEGDTHSAVEADGGRLLITADEDGDPTPAANAIRVLAPAALAGSQPAIELSLTRQLAETGPLRGKVVYVGSALPNVDLLADPTGKIALLDPDQGASRRRNQITRLQEAGAAAVLLSQPLLRLEKRDERLTLPGAALRAEGARALREALEQGERVEVELAAGPAGWGYVRLWDIQDKSHPVQVGRFATPDTLRFPPRQPNAFAFTAHNPFVRGDRLYVSWYSDGVRVVDIRDPAQPREIGQFVPPFPEGTPILKEPPGAFGSYPQVWGVVEHNGLILMSDMQSGLWIVRDLPR